MSSVAVIGGGPAGMLAAAAAAKNGHAVTLFERNEKLGKKLYLTGKGRCNITNLAPMDEFMANIAKNPRFLYSAFNAFDNHDIVRLINSMGVPTKTERGNRVFPESDKSSDVIKALSSYAVKCGVNVVVNKRIAAIAKDGESGKFALEGIGRTFDSVIIATGGASYKSTGSTGDGYAFAESFGHKVNPPMPALIPLVSSEDWCRELMGLSLKNVTLKAYRGKKCVYEELGELLFTHFGVSGPLVLTLSSIIADMPSGISCQIDLKPGLTHEELDKRLLRDFEKHKHKQLNNAMIDLLPHRLIATVIEQSGIAPETGVDGITREQRRKLTETLKKLEFTVKETLPINEAIITRGGVDVKGINPSTMESKLTEGLFFAGEVIDVDAFTGGFNLQIAYSTAFLAGNSVR